MRPTDSSVDQRRVFRQIWEHKPYKRVQKHDNQQSEGEGTSLKGYGDRKFPHDSILAEIRPSAPRTGDSEELPISGFCGERPSDKWIALPQKLLYSRRARAMPTLPDLFSPDLSLASTDSISDAQAKSRLERLAALDWKKDGVWVKAVAELTKYFRQFRDLDEWYASSASATERMELHEKLAKIWKWAFDEWALIAGGRRNILQDDTADPSLLEGVDWPQKEREWWWLEQTYRRHLTEHDVYAKHLRMAQQDEPEDAETRDITGEKRKDQTTPPPPRPAERPEQASTRHRIFFNSALWSHEPVNASNAGPSNGGYQLPMANCGAQTVTPVPRPSNDNEGVTRWSPHSLYPDYRAYISSDEEESVDSDCLSISVDSEQDMEMPVASDAVIECALRHILRRYQAEKQCGQTHNSAKGKAAVPAPPYNTPALLGRKYGRSEETSTDGSSSSFPLTKKQKTGREQQRALACPFWKRNPREHRKCFRYKLNRIRDVKQHIQRCHHPPWRCMRCGEIFPSEETRDAHARADEACAVRHSVHDDLSQSQMKALTRRSNPRYTVEEQWYAIWDILFPGADRPASPYIDGVLSEEISSFQEFYQTRGAAILREALQESLMHNTSTQEVQQYSDLVLRAALDRILDEWLSAQTDDASSSSAQPATRATLSPSSEINANPSTSESQTAISESGGGGAFDMTHARTDPVSSSFPFTFDRLEDSPQIDFAAWNEYNLFMDDSEDAYRRSGGKYLDPTDSMQLRVP